MLLALIIVGALVFVAIVRLYPKERSTIVRDCALAISGGAVGVPAGLMIASYYETRQEFSESEARLETIIRSLDTAIAQTKEYIATLQAYPDEYDRPGRAINIDTCYSEIERSDSFAAVKQSLYPRAAITLMTDDAIRFAGLPLYEKLGDTLQELRRVQENDGLICNPAIEACALCKPANMLTAYMYRTTLEEARAAALFQLGALGESGDRQELAENFDTERRGLICVSLTDAKDNVPQAFAPFDIDAALGPCE